MLKSLRIGGPKLSVELIFVAISDSSSLYTYGWSKYGQLVHHDNEDHLGPCHVEGLRNAHITQMSDG